MIKLQYDEKPKNKKYLYNITINPHDKHSDVIWLTTEEQISDDKPIEKMQDCPLKQEIMNKMNTWTIQANMHSNDKEWWPVKLASIQ